MFWEGYSVHMSLVASRARHDDMLAFSAAHGVKPAVEMFPMSEEGLATALDKLNTNKMRYRGVLVAP
jgi:D-arabinose 1-dehydrogenase-like Zn-dependent alcohol dehydrogenase